MNSNFQNLNILVVEDEPNLGSTLQEYLEAKRFNCKLATTAEKAREIFFTENFAAHVVLMDIGLPDGDGLELAKVMRESRKDFVLLFLSALNDPETKLQGLELGAQDYITKPFDLRELMLRLERILQTTEKFKQIQDEVVLGPLKIWFKRYEVADMNGNILSLSQKECAILEMLYEKMPEAISRDEIIDTVWGEGAFPSNRTVDNYIVKLRKWTETSDSVKITSIRGIGYRLEVKE
jgi:two-component system alkaline phosphatase synthesis response regulator PhoP